jgi:hypothetical protein
MKITRGTDDENKKVELNTNEARQATAGHNVRYVLLFGLLGVVIAFLFVFLS